MENKIKKVIYFVGNHFSERDYKRFGIEIIQDNGYDVEVWDFTPFLRPEYVKTVFVNEPETFNWYKKIFNKIEVSIKISGLNESCFVVCLLGYDISSIPVYKELSKNNIRYSVFVANAIPTKVNNGKKFSVLDNVRRITCYNMANYILKHIPFAFLGIKPATLIFAGGEQSLVNNYPTNRETEVMWLHSLDYDIFLEESSKSETKTNVGVFLDEYYPFHPDYTYLNIPPPLKPEEYYPQLCQLFRYLEQNLDVEIIIAAHPRSHYEEHPDYFEGRSIIKGRTIELIKNSTFCIVHSSTAIGFPILFEKPIIFITNNKINQSIFGKYIEFMASLLNKNVINIDDEIRMDINAELMIAKEAYNKYKNDYIKREGSEEIPFWQIVSNRLKEGF